MLNYNHLYYFHVVATEGSFANAAERLGVTQPTISEQVKALERSLGVALFERLRSGLRLTEQGRITLEHTAAMFKASDGLRNALGSEEAEVPRTLNIGISGSVGRATSANFMLPLLALKEFVPSIRSGESTELLRDLRSNNLDLAVVEAEPEGGIGRGLEVVRLDSITLVAVVSPATTPSTDWRELGLVHYRPSSAFRWDVDEYLEANNLRPYVAGESDDALFLVEAAAHGGFVAFVPRSVARASIDSGRLKALSTTRARHAGVFAVFQDSEAAEIVRRSVEVLAKHAEKAD